MRAVWTDPVAAQLRTLWRAGAGLDEMVAALGFSGRSIVSKARNLGESKRVFNHATAFIPSHNWRRAKEVAEYLGAPDPYLPTADGNNAHVAAVMLASGKRGFPAINLARRS